MGAHSKGGAGQPAEGPSQETRVSTRCGPSVSPSSPCSSALDAIQEALQLLESVRPEAHAKDQLLDDKAQALLWLYICTLETKMQEVSVAPVGLGRTGYRDYFPQVHSKLVPALCFILIPTPTPI